MKNILITGGSGFIARNLSEHLKNKYNIFAPTSRELDLCEFEAIEGFVVRYKVDVIIHTAHYNKKRCDERPDKEVEYDLRMLLNLEKISHQLDKVLYFGSGAEFDKRHDISLAKEEDFGNSIPDTPYGFSKYASNMITRKSSNIYNLRLFGLFGKYEDWKMYFISNVCCKALCDLPLTIRQDCYFDYIYVEDLSRIVEWFLENKPRFHDYNVCSGKRVLLSDIAEIVRRVSNKPELPIIIDKSGLNIEYTGDNSCLKREIPDFYLMKLEIAIKNLFDWYSDNISIIDYDILKNAK